MPVPLWLTYLERASEFASVSGPAGPPAGQRTGSRHQPLLGGLLVKEGLINHAHLHRMLTLQQAREPRPLLGQMLLDEKLITSHELSAVLSKYDRKRLRGNVLIESKLG